jgi:hypothetical protein
MVKGMEQKETTVATQLLLIAACEGMFRDAAGTGVVAEGARIAAMEIA